MNESLPSDLKAFVRQKVESGQFPTEEKVIEAALRLFREQESSQIDRLIDDEFVEYCDREGDDCVTLEEILRVTSKIPGSMAQVIMEEERAERF